MKAEDTPKPAEEPPALQPGSDDYIYVDEKLDSKMAKICCDYWDVIENGYIKNSKFVFRNIRYEREQIIRYLFNTKSDFVEYLKRPDAKQIEIESFIKVLIYFYYLNFFNE